MTHSLWIAPLAAIAMVVQDILGAFLGQAEARNKDNLSGLLDAVSWLVGIFTISWSLTAIGSHNQVLKWTVVGAVTGANFVGSKTGVRLGQRYIRAAEPAQRRIELVEQRLARLEVARPPYRRPVREERPL